RRHGDAARFRWNSHRSGDQIGPITDQADSSAFSLGAGAGQVAWNCVAPDEVAFGLMTTSSTEPEVTEAPWVPPTPHVTSRLPLTWRSSVLWSRLPLITQ